MTKRKESPEEVGIWERVEEVREKEGVKRRRKGASGLGDE
jgi:hypothetical protein